MTDQELKAIEERVANPDEYNFLSRTAREALASKDILALLIEIRRLRQPRRVTVHANYDSPIEVSDVDPGVTLVVHGPLCTNFRAMEGTRVEWDIDSVTDEDGVDRDFLLFTHKP